MVHSPGQVGDGDHKSAALVELRGRDSADVAEALDGAALAGEGRSQPLAAALDHHHDAGARGLVAKKRAAQRDRLAGDDLGDGVTDLHRIGVHHPSHRLLIRGHVRRGYVLLGPQHRQELGGEATRERLQLVRGELARTTTDAALCPTVGQAQQCAFPGHPHRQRGALAEIDLRVVANAALRRTEHARVLDAVAREHSPASVVEPDRHADDERALGIAQPFGDGIADGGVREGLLELRDRLVEEGRFPLEVPRIVRDVLHFGHRKESRCGQDGLAANRFGRHHETL